MSRTIVFALSALGLVATSAPVFAQDASTFRQCQSCHVVTAPDGTNIAGRGRTGPNLYGVIGRQAGTVDGFSYGPSIVAAGQGGLVWTQENLAAYVADPTGFLREVTGDNSARSRMSFRARSGAAEVAAFLATAG